MKSDEIFGRYILGDAILSERPHITDNWPIPFGFGQYVVDFISWEDREQKSFAFQSLRLVDDALKSEPLSLRSLTLATADWTQESNVVVEDAVEKERLIAEMAAEYEGKVNV